MAVNDLSFGELKADLVDPARTRSRGFGLLRDLCTFACSHENEGEVHELVLRAMEKRADFGPLAEIVDSLAREIGLFPYLDPGALPISDQLAYEAHRPAGMGEEIVFHHPQAVVYRTLMDGNSVILSAPTSFGKSLIIDALIASEKFRNLVIVVPTLALIDETRRRLAQRFRGRFKVITHRSQRPADRNVFVLTQERTLEYDQLAADLLVIDEFYKLTPAEPDDQRAVLLNLAFDRLYRRTKQFYMLGPFIERIAAGFRARIRCEFFVQNYTTVVSELHRVERGADEFASLTELCRRLGEPTIVFCSSPNRAAEVAVALTRAGLGRPGAETAAAADWVGEHYHPEWHFGVALRQGIGVHHGRIPRSLAQYVVRLFNDEHVSILVCTSTLIEGVNTKAKNIVIFDNRINTNPIDLFTFNNIRGRSGRMRQHFVGHVYVFDAPPAGGFPEVDVPVVTQPATAPETLLIQIDERELTNESRQRLRRFADQEVIGYETLRANTGVDLQRQLDLARHMTDNLGTLGPRLRWTGMPTYDQLRAVCELMWNHFGGLELGSRSVRSHSHLTYLIWNLRNAPAVADVIGSFLTGPNPSPPDEAVRRSLDFLRLWANFHFPRLLRAIDRIQRDVFARQRSPLPAGNYEYFAARVENYFLDPALVALDEYGLPLEIARQIVSALQPDGDVDAVLSRLSRLDARTLPLTPFERSMVRSVQESL